MISLSFDNGTVEPFTLILTSRNQNKLGQISNTRAVKYSAKLNGADELSFEVCKQLDDHEEILWDDIYDLRLVWIKELDKYFEIKVTLVDKVYMVKTITCTELCECELSQTGLYDIEINTAADIARPDYDANYPTVFYRVLPSDPTSEDYKKKKNSSLMHRILDKVPAYTLKHIDSSLMDLQRTFSISNTTVYDFLTGECSEQFNCLFQFDSKDRTISAYDLYTVCRDCGNRGDFNDVCPECGSTNLKYFGEDTTIFVSTENLTDEVHFETDTDNIKNTFRLEAGDDNMTAAIINSNPNGSRYIYEFSDEARRDMPSELTSKMDDYDEEYEYYNNEYPIHLNSSAINRFNQVARKYSLMTCQVCGYRGNFTNLCPNCGSHEIAQKTWPSITSTITGYKNLIPYYYECVDLYSYLKSSMMPKVIITGTTPRSEAEKLNTSLGNINFVLGMSRVSNSTNLSTVNSAVTNWAKALVNTGVVKVAVDTDSANSFTYQGETSGVNWGAWVGRIKVTNYTDDSDFVYTNSFRIRVNDKLDDYIEEKISKQILSKCDEEVYDVIKLIAQRRTSDFRNVIRLYSANRLQSFHDAIEAAIGILIDSGQGNSGKTICNDCGYKGYFNAVCPSCGSTDIQKSGSPKSMLYDDFYTPYYQMLEICEDELNTRNREADIVWGSYDMNGVIIADGMIQYVASEIKRIHDILNFRNFIGEDLYKLFTTYIREQTYTNSNYISDGLDDYQLFDNAELFLERAREELHKAATYQHSIKSNLDNLLVIDEFKPLLNKFELGNWLRVQADETIYRLRLIAYSIDFDSLQTINTEFSDVTITANGFNDIVSIINQAQSMSTTYGYVEKQAETGAEVKTGYIDEWVEKGLNSALVRINNNNDEDIRIDEAGITARTYDDVSETYDKEQLRMTHNVIAFTDDGWESVKTALGKFMMSHHTVVSDSWGGINDDINAVSQYDDYGLVANAVLAGWIVGSFMESSTIIGSHFQAPGNDSYIDMANTDTAGREYFIKCAYGGVNKFTVDKQGRVIATDVDVKGGSIAGANLLLGGVDNKNGTCEVFDAANRKVVTIDNNGITMYMGVIQSPDYAEKDPPSTYSQSGMMIDVVNKIFKSPYFAINPSGAYFNGNIEIRGDIDLGTGSFNFRPTDYYLADYFNFTFKAQDGYAGTSYAEIEWHEYEFNSAEDRWVEKSGSPYIDTVTIYNDLPATSPTYSNMIGANGHDYLRVRISSGSRVKTKIADAILAKVDSNGFHGQLEGIFKGYLSSNSGQINGFNYGVTAGSYGDGFFENEDGYEFNMRGAFLRPDGAMLELNDEGITVVGNYTATSRLRHTGEHQMQEIVQTVPAWGNGVPNIYRSIQGDSSSAGIEYVLWRNDILYNMQDLTPGVSPLKEGQVYLVYE